MNQKTTDNLSPVLNNLVWHKREEAESMHLKNFGKYLCRYTFDSDDYPAEPDNENEAYYGVFDWLLMGYDEETNQPYWKPHFANEGYEGLIITHFADFSRPKVGIT